MCVEYLIILIVGLWSPCDLVTYIYVQSAVLQSKLTGYAAISDLSPLQLFRYLKAKLVFILIILCEH